MYVSPAESRKVQARKAAVHAANLAAIEARKVESRGAAFRVMGLVTLAKSTDRKGPARDAKGRFVKASA